MRFVRIKRTAKLGFKSLWMHRLRSILTMLGIIFGVCSVIAMLAIGEGASQEAQAMIARLGSTNLIIETNAITKTQKNNKNSGKDDSENNDLSNEESTTDSSNETESNFDSTSEVTINYVDNASGISADELGIVANETGVSALESGKFADEPG